MDRIGLVYQSKSYAQFVKNTFEDRPSGYEVDIISWSDIIWSNKYDLIQTDELIRFGTLAVVAGKLTDIPVVAHIKGWGDLLNAHNKFNTAENIGVKILSAIASRGVDGVCYVSKATEQRLPYTFDQYRYVAPFIDKKAFEPYTDNVERGVESILTVTNLRYEEKLRGVLDILQGLQPIFSDFDNIQYYVAGGGKYLETLKKAASEYEYSDRINVLGYRDDIPKILNESDIFVYLSFLDACPRAILEAEAAGLPVVAGDKGGLSEAAGDAALVCPPTPEGIATSVRALVKNDKLRKEIGIECRRRMKNHNLRQANKVVSLWDELI